MKYIKFIVFVSFFFGGFSCNSSEDEELPKNVIDSETGLFINLEWTTGGSVSQSQDDIDLELFLLKGNEEIDASTSLSFEEVKIEDFYADGAYLVRVEYYSGASNVDYSIYVRGGSSTDNNVYEGSLLSSDKGVFVDYLQITKVGNRYTLTDL